MLDAPSYIEVFTTAFAADAVAAALPVLVSGQPGRPQRFAIPSAAYPAGIHVPPGDSEFRDAVLRPGKL